MVVLFGNQLMSNSGYRPYYANCYRNRFNGKIVLEGVSLPEGAVVTVVARGADENFLLTEAQENELLAAIAEIDHGEYETLEELLSSLPVHS